MTAAPARGNTIQSNAPVLPATRGRMMRPDEASLLVSCLATRTQRRRGSGPAASAPGAAAPAVAGRKALLAAEDEVGELADGLASLRGRCRATSVTGAAAAGGPAAVDAAGCKRQGAHGMIGLTALLHSLEV